MGHYLSEMEEVCGPLFLDDVPEARTEKRRTALNRGREGMSAKVDFLAAMDMAIDESDDVSRRDLERARAAIAELIAAADRAEKCLPYGHPEAVALRAALAAVTGEVQG